MPSTWNKVWAAGDAYNTAAVFNTYVAAITERFAGLYQIGGSLIAFPTQSAGSIAHKDATRGSLTAAVDSDPLYYTCSATSYTGTGTPPTMSWYALQMLGVKLASSYLDPDLITTGLSLLDTSTQAATYDDYYTGSHSTAEGAFRGFTLLNRRFPLLARQREREITSLSAGGTDGQVARFCYRTSTHTIDGPYVRHTNAYPDQAASASGDLAKGGKVYVRTGGAWVESIDPAQRPDRITLNGLARPGDLFLPHLLNQLRDLINLCTILPLNANWGASGRRRYYNAGTAPVEQDVTWNGPPMCWATYSPTLSASLRRTYSTGENTLSTHFAATTLPRRTRFYWSVQPGKKPFRYTGVGGDPDGNTDSVPVNVFADHGFAVSVKSDTYPVSLFAYDAGVGSAADVTTPTIGDATYTPTTEVTDRYVGWDAGAGGRFPTGYQPQFATADFAVEGGFQYTAATP